MLLHSTWPLSSLCKWQCPFLCEVKTSQRIVNFEGGGVVPHTQMCFSHTMGAFCAALVTETKHRRKCARHPPTRRIPDQCKPAARTWEGSHLENLEERDTGKQRHPCRWHRSPKRKTLCTCDCTKSHRNPTRLSCQGSNRRPPAART